MTSTRRKPDFILVGAPRCATTAMWHYLGLHPGIFLPERKEVHFFGADLSKMDGYLEFVSDADAYCRLFEGARDDQIVGEASVMYLYSRVAAREIKEFVPDVKILIQLRNPVDMMYSHHTQQLMTVSEDIEDFEEALEAESDRLLGKRIPNSSAFPDGLFYRDTARFSEQIERYFDVFGRDRVHIVLYDDVRRDLPGAYRGVLEFLFVDPEFQPEFTLVNQARRVRNRQLQRMVMKPPLPIQILLRGLPESFRHRMRLSIVNRNTIEYERPRMSNELRAQLSREFAPEVERLGRLLGRDLSHWSKA